MKRIGTEMPLTDEERERLLAELQYWKDDSVNFMADREKEEKAFLCQWEGQNPAGVRKDTNEKAAFPFEGASDQRVRWGDEAFQEYLSMIMVALDTGKIEITCSGTDDTEARATAIQNVIEWVRSKLGAKWYRQIMALLRYMLVDTPAVAAMDVGWREKRTMGVERFTTESLRDEYTIWRVNSGAIAETDAAIEFASAVAGEWDDATMENVVRFMTDVKGVRAKDVDAVLEALDEDGECECLALADKWEGPEIAALRYGDDFIIPENTEDFDYADPLIRQQWLTEAQLKEIAASGDWDQAWVEETLAHKGEGFYQEWKSKYDNDDFKNSVNICWFYTAETDDDGVTTRYVTVLSLAEGSAFGRRVLKSRRGRWETIFFQREVLAGNCLASRGLAHICAPAQGLGKSLSDSANNNAIIGSVPPVKAKGARVRNVVIEPLALIEMGASDDVNFMQPPAYPAAARERIKELKDDLLAFLGLSNGQTDTSVRQRSFSAWMMSQFEELYKRLVEAVQDYASDEALLSVTGYGDTKGLRREDIEGDFQIALKFNPANMNHKDLIDRATAIGQIIAPMDSKNEIDRGPVVKNVFRQLFPELANTAFKSAAAMQADDIKEEEQNFVKIKAGIMPTMDTEGKWNYEARLQFYQQLQAENPEAIEDMGPASQEIFQKWLAALEQQARQFGENAQIGRTGVEGVRG